jgi:hypothetical protein
MRGGARFPPLAAAACFARPDRRCCGTCGTAHVRHRRRPPCAACGRRCDLARRGMAQWTPTCMGRRRCQSVHAPPAIGRAVFQPWLQGFVSLRVG